MRLNRFRPHLLAAPSLAAVALVLGWGAADAQELRSSLAQAAERMAQSTDPTLGPTGVRQPVAFDPANIAPGISAVTPPGGSPSGASASGATSRRAATRASRPVKRDTTAQGLKKPLKPTAKHVLGLPAPPPEMPVLRRRPPREVDPWQPLGVEVGGVRIRPSIEVISGYEDNPERQARGKKGSALLRTDGEIEAQSEWSRHELKAKLKGGYIRYFNAPDASRPDVEGSANLRFDIQRETRADIETRLKIDSQRPGTAEANTQAVGRPLIYNYGVSTGIIQDINRLGLALRGSVDRTEYQDGQLSNGGKVDLSSRNATQYGLRGRISYELTPGMRPFIDLLADTRRFDQTVDPSGYRRNSNGLGARVGSTFEMSRHLVGEVAVGYQTRKFDDSRLPELRGLIGEASLVWSATELTTVNLKGSLELADTTLANVSGAQVRKIEAQVVHALRRNVNVIGYASFGQTAYDGIRLQEDILAIGARIDYKLTRTTAIRASFTHERFKTTTPGADYTANIALIGLKFSL